MCEIFFFRHKTNKPTLSDIFYFPVVLGITPAIYVYYYFEVLHRLIQCEPGVQNILLRPVFTGAESGEKSERFVATFGRKLSSITLFVHARYGARKFSCTGLVECGGVLVQSSKVQVPATLKFMAEKVERCLGGRDAHSREGSHVLEGISRCQNLKIRAHLSQQEAASGSWISIKTS